MAETESTDQGQSSTDQEQSSTDQEQSSNEQQGGTLPEPGEIIIEKGAQAPPRPGPVSEIPNPEPATNPNVPIQKSQDLTAAEPRTEPSQSGEASGSSDKSSGE